MDLKGKYHKYSQKFGEIWKTGKIQRSSRITYDVFWNVVIFFLIIGFIGLFFAGGIGAGYFASLVEDEPVRSYEEMKQHLFDYSETSKLYFADEVYFGDISSDVHREEISLENISDHLINAVIATEDEYFETHEGIVPKALLRAMMQEFTNSEVQTGGSTLTQQVIKNQILTNEVSFERKAKEILLALRLERFFEKDDILNAYLNIVPFGRDAAGRNIAGVQTAAKGIFNVNADELNLPQAAYIAGLPQSPFAYTPFKNAGGLKTEEGMQKGLQRMQSVLDRMKEEEYITEEEYQEATSYDIVADFREDFPLPRDTYPRLTDELKSRAVDKLTMVIAEEDGYTKEELENKESLKERYRERARTDLSTKGYQVHSTIDKEIYDSMQEVTENFGDFGPTWTGNITRADGEVIETTQHVQASAVMIENSTGRIISFVAGNDPEKDYNFATAAKRSNGSTMKPLLVFAPAMEEGLIQPGTPVADVDLPVAGDWKPSNYSGSHYGLIPARKALYNSYNVSTSRIYKKMLDSNPDRNPVEKYLQKMGITTVDPKEGYYPSLSIGATTTGVTVEENTNAFATFGNKGKFADGYMIDKITTADGEIIFEKEVETEEVFSPQTSYLTLDMMRDVMDKGTGTYANSQLSNQSVDWASKSGTGQEWKDVWFMGVNPNVTIGTWMGYEIPKPLYRSWDPQGHSQRVQRFWAQLVNSAAQADPELVTPSESFEQPEGIVSRSYCAISGKLPSSLCEAAGLIKADLFNEKYVPTETDDSLIRGNSVQVNGRSVEADSNTPKEFINSNGLAFNPEFLEENGYDQLNSIRELYPRTDRDRWERIGAPSSGTTTIEDNDQAPSAPEALSSSGDSLAWNSSNSPDVAGYRIYHAEDRNGSYSQIGNTTSTSYSSLPGDGVYHVRAVDYYGRQSTPSAEIVVGELAATASSQETTNESQTNVEQLSNEETEEDSEIEAVDQGTEDEGSESQDGSIEEENHERE
ncbi:transglycosylase domain-containing protein [Virgibacillus sediminis]|uniref:Transglycosylase domain-containing protein n=1 Tax=Virgibacillus sediminis TaxID=202260 RepID=A0ABV7A6M9_9BACI